MNELLLDQGLPRSTADFLIQSGTKTAHAADVGLSRASDSEILEYARQRNLIIVTLDADFNMLLAASGAASPSVIRLRQQRLNGREAAVMISSVLERSCRALEAGAVVSVTRTLMRVKVRPLTRPRSTSDF